MQLTVFFQVLFDWKNPDAKSIVPIDCSMHSSDFELARMEAQFAAIENRTINATIIELARGSEANCVHEEGPWPTYSKVCEWDGKDEECSLLAQSVSFFSTVVVALISAIFTVPIEAIMIKFFPRPNPAALKHERERRAKLTTKLMAVNLNTTKQQLEDMAASATHAAQQGFLDASKKLKDASKILKNRERVKKLAEEDSQLVDRMLATYITQSGKAGKTITITPGSWLHASEFKQLRTGFRKAVAEKRSLEKKLMLMPGEVERQRFLVEYCRTAHLSVVEKTLYMMNPSAENKFDSLPALPSQYIVWVVWLIAIGYLAGAGFYVLWFGLRRGSGITMGWLATTSFTILWECFISIPLSLFMLNTIIPKLLGPQIRSLDSDVRGLGEKVQALQGDDAAIVMEVLEFNAALASKNAKAIQDKKSSGTVHPEGEVELPVKMTGSDVSAAAFSMLSIHESAHDETPVSKLTLPVDTIHARKSAPIHVDFEGKEEEFDIHVTDADSKLGEESQPELSGTESHDAWPGLPGVVPAAEASHPVQRFVTEDATRQLQHETSDIESLKLQYPSLFRRDLDNVSSGSQPLVQQRQALPGIGASRSGKAASPPYVTDITDL